MDKPNHRSRRALHAGRAAKVDDSPRSAVAGALLPREQRALQRLNTNLKRVVRWLGMFEVLCILGSFVLVSFALDYVLELPWILRLLLLATAVAAVVRVVARSHRRLGHGVPAEDLLRTVEEQYPSLDGQLMNTAEFQVDLRRERGPRHDLLSRYLLLRAARESQTSLASLRIERSLNMAPLAGRVALAIVGATLVLLLVAGLPREMGTWTARNVFLSTGRWPRRTHFALDRAGPVWLHPRKDPLSIDAWVIGPRPREVTLHLRTSEEHREARLVPGLLRRDTWEIASATRAGAPEPGRPANGHRVTYTIPAVLERFEFWLAAGDNQSETITVDVRDRPRIESTRFTLLPPPHTGQATRSIENPPAEVGAPEGTRITVEATSSEPITTAWLRFGDGAPEKATEVETRSFRHPFELRESAFLEIGLSGGEWELEARPVRFSLVAYPDRVPTVTLEVHGETRLVTPAGRLDYRVLARDDHGFSEIRLERRVLEPGGTDPTDEPPPFEDLAPWSAGEEDGEVVVESEGKLALAPLGLEPGSRLVLQAVAIDNDAPSGFKIGRSQTETFLVVNPDQLLEEMDRIRVQAEAKLEELAHVERSVVEALERRASSGDAGPSGEASAEQVERSGDATEDRPLSGSPASPDDGPNETADEGRPGTGGEPADGSSREPPESAAPPDSGDSPETAGAERERQAGNPAERVSPGDPSAATGSARTGREDSPSSLDARSESDGGAQRREPGGTPSLESLSDRQDQVRRELQDLDGRLDDMRRTLEDNGLLEEEERTRFEQEIESPLERIAGERLPRSARELDSMDQRTPGPSPRELARTREEVDRIATDLEDVARSLGASKQFGELLERLKLILELQEDVEEKTRKELER